MSSRRPDFTHALSAQAVVSRARPLLELDGSGRPKCKDASAVVGAIRGLLKTRHDDAIQELLVEGFLRGSSRRFAEYVSPQMNRVDGGRLSMGREPSSGSHFCGESPSHVVELSPFAIQRIPVTNELYGLIDERRRDMPAGDRYKPAVNLTWFDALLFAVWVGCRLPSEAEWEFACGCGVDAEWCCQHGGDLPKHAWLSDNAEGELHMVARRDSNAFGLFDMHGNVWEWCQDAYDQDYYARSPGSDPVNRDDQANLGEGCSPDRSCRGGSFISFAEMCRTRYRFHEPPGFFAADLGFRLARSRDAALEEDYL